MTRAPPPPPPVQRMLVIGDSVAQTLGRGLERWGPQHGVTVMNESRPALLRDRDRWAHPGTARQDPRHLRAASGPLAGDLDQLRPDLVVVLSTIWDIGGRQRDEWGPDYVDVGDPRFDQFIVSEWQRATDLLTSPRCRIVWLTAPCSADAAVSEKLSYANHHYLPELVRTRPVITVDLAGSVCPEGKFSDLSSARSPTRDPRHALLGPGRRLGGELAARASSIRGCVTRRSRRPAPAVSNRGSWDPIPNMTLQSGSWLSRCASSPSVRPHPACG